jgi:hypothetical protein
MLRWLPILVGLLPLSTAAAQECERGQQLTLDLERSEIRWRGTKCWGTGKHEGTVQFASGAICVADGRVTGGWFVADMTTIAITDMPPHEEVPRRRLRTHLMEEDFFHVEAYPTARFLLTSAQPTAPHRYRVEGDLTIRGHTHPVTFSAEASLTQDGVRATGELEIDRHRFGVSYQRVTLRDFLVDDTFRLDLAIEARGRGTSAPYPTY